MNDLIQGYLEAKAEELNATAKREYFEGLILQKIKAPEDGSKSTKVDGYRITTQGRLNYRADMPHLMILSTALPESLRPIKQETTLDKTVAKQIRTKHADLWQIIAPAIEIKPGKSSIRIEQIN